MGMKTYVQMVWDLTIIGYLIRLSGLDELLEFSERQGTRLRFLWRRQYGGDFGQCLRRGFGFVLLDILLRKGTASCPTSRGLHQMTR